MTHDRFSHSMTQQAQAAPIRIEVWSDVACPWCLLGKAHLEQAIEQLGIEAEVEMRSHQLAPSLASAMPVKEYLAKRYGAASGIEASQKRLVDMGERVGINFQFDAAIMANTFDAHRVHHLAKARGLDGVMMARLLRAQHSEGADVSSHETLRRLAIEAGLAGAEVDEVLATDAYADAVREEIEEGRALGVQGVPFFVIDRKYGLSGAQPVEAFVRALRMARDAAE